MGRHRCHGAAQTGHEAVVLLLLEKEKGGQRRLALSQLCQQIGEYVVRLLFMLMLPSKVAVGVSDSYCGITVELLAKMVEHD